MSSHNGSTSAKGAAGHFLEFAFTEGSYRKGKKSAASHIDTGKVASEIDIRECHPKDRAMLGKGTSKVIFILNGIDPKQFPRMSRPLFLATSTNPSIAVDGKIDLSHVVDPLGVIALVEYMNSSPSSTYENLHMPYSRLSIFKMLSITMAGKMLGMNEYVDHVYRGCEARLRNNKLTPLELNAVTVFAAEHSRLFDIVAKQLLRDLQDGTAPQALPTYLAKNTTLGARVNAIQASQNHHAIREEEMLHSQQVRKETQQEKAKRDAEERAFWKAKNDASSANEQACLAFMRTPVNQRKKLTAEQKAHWLRTRGTQPPHGS